jgi:hypothetical protein
MRHFTINSFLCICLASCASLQPLKPKQVAGEVKAAVWGITLGYWGITLTANYTQQYDPKQLH